jgi:hypothetical protein
MSGGVVGVVGWFGGAKRRTGKSALRRWVDGWACFGATGRADFLVRRAFRAIGRVACERGLGFRVSRSDFCA